MKTAILKYQNYEGPTVNPNGKVLARLLRQFRNVRGPEQAKQCFKSWGLFEDASPVKGKS